MANPYNQEIYNVWAYRVLNDNDTLTYENLKAITDTAVQAIDAGLNNQNYQRSDLANVVYAKEAMERVRFARTRWWKFWNPVQNYRERKYHEALVGKIDEYKEQLPVEDILRAVDGEPLKRTYEKGVVKQKELSPEEKLERAISNPDIKEELVEGLVEVLPESSLNKGVQKTFLQVGIIPEMLKRMKTCNRRFLEVVDEGESAESQMVQMVGDLYDGAYAIIGTIGYTDPKEQILATQIVVDAVMKKTSPIIINPELGKFAEGYVVKHAKEFKKFEYIDANAPEMNEAKAEYESREIQKIQVKEVLLDDSNVPKVKPIAPSLSNKEKEMVNNY